MTVLCRPPAELLASLCGIAESETAAVGRASAAIDLVRAAAELGFEPRPPTPPPTPGAAGAAGGDGVFVGGDGVFVAGGGFVDTAAPSDPLQVRTLLYDESFLSPRSPDVFPALPFPPFCRLLVHSPRSKQ